MFINRSAKTDREQYLEGEIERYEESERQRTEAELRKRDRQEEERRQRYEETLRSADDWKEALSKNIVLCRREIESINAINPDEPPLDPEEDGLEQSARACERALVIWAEVEGSKQAEIEDLENRIQQIRDSIRSEVANRLEAENNRAEWSLVSYSIRKQEPWEFLNW